MSPKTPPGQTRRQVHRYVKERLLDGNPPTVREVQEIFGFKSVQSAREHLEMLVKEGKLTKEPGVARGYRLPDEMVPLSPAFPVPVLGQVQAGDLTAAVEDPDGGYIGYHSRRTHGENNLFALRVRGESMIDAGILPGDLVIVRVQPTGDDGDIVVALVEDDATVKRLRFSRAGHPELHPENPNFKPIVPDPGARLIILGKVVEVRRFLDGAVS